MKKPDICPWCGKEPEVFQWSGFFTGKKLAEYGVNCDNDDCPVGPQTGGYPTKEEAIAAWNRRAKEGES